MKKNKDMVVVRNKKTRKVAYIIDKKRKIINYFLAPKAPQSRFIQGFTLVGFDQLPAGFYRSGFGLTSKGYYIVEEIANKFNKKIYLFISNDKTNKVIRLQNKVKITISYQELFRTLLRLREINQERNEQIKNSVRNFLHKSFPRSFLAIAQTEASLYKKNSLFYLFNKTEIIQNLSENDVNKLSEFYSEFLKFYSDKLKGKKKFLEISRKKKITEVIFLENIIKDFQRRLKAKNHNETRWQEFLKKYILFLQLNYVKVLEKKNISLEGKYPDFLLVDVYNYIDIYEIKKPDTNLLRLDKSRNNYYWDTELSKAISQVENYIDNINKNSFPFREMLRKKENIDIRIIKPRGFIIAGTRKQLNGEAIEDNFRLLNRALKNVEVVLYDELFDNLKNFLAKLKAV